MMNTRRRHGGFSLGEVAIVVAIIAILIAVAIPTYFRQLEQNRDAATVSNLRLAYAEASADYIKHGSATTGEYVVVVDEVRFESKDATLDYSGDELPFDINSEIPGPGVHKVAFHFNTGTRDYITIDGEEASTTPTAPTEEKYWTVTFHAAPNGRIGGQETKSVKVKDGETVSSLTPSPASAEYTFDGWKTVSADGASYLFTSAVTADLDLYAHYTKEETWNVTFHAGEHGHFSEGATRVVPVKKDGSLGKPAGLICDPGWELAEWQLSSTAVTWPIEKVTSNLELTATYKKAEWTVTLNTGDHGEFSDGQKQHVLQVEKGSKLTAPELNIEDGWVIDAWKSGTSSITFPIEVNGDLSLTATYTREKCTVRFNGLGGRFSDGFTSMTKEVEKGGKVDKPAYAAPAGTTFVCWAKQDGSDIGDLEWPITVTENMNLSAVYSWTVTFHAEPGGKFPDGEETKTVQVRHGKELSELPADPVSNVEDSSFLGWKTGSSSGPDYSFEKKVTSAFDLYAAYSEVYYDVTFNGNGGKFSDGSLTKTYSILKGTELSEPTNYTHPAGSKFKGWELNGSIVENWPIAVNSHLNFIAVYEWPVTFKAGNGKFQDGSNTKTEYYLPGQCVVDTPKPSSLNGMTFANSWKPEGNYTIDDEIDGPREFTAVYKWKVTLNPKSGSLTGDKTLYFDNNASMSKPSYTAPSVNNVKAEFVGWAKNGNYNDIITSWPINVTGNLDLTAVYQWTVTFNAGTDGRITGNKPNPVKVYDGSNITKEQYPGNPTPYDSDYVFVGWEYNGKTYEDADDISAIQVTSPITFKAKYRDDGGCFASGTLITLADGSRKPVEELTFDDMLLVWNFFDGSYSASPAVALVDHGEDDYTVAKLLFSDGTQLSIIGDHGVFDYDLNRFVFLTPAIGADYIGHRFVRADVDGTYDVVTLESIVVSQERTHAWSIVSAGALNAFASDMLTLAPPSEAFNWIPMGEKLHYDVEQLQREIAEHGTFEYAQFADLVTEEQFEALNGRYLKVVVDKGLMSVDDLCEMVKTYLPFMQ